jgi:hypothetical protein
VTYYVLQFLSTGESRAVGICVNNLSKPLAT